MDIISIIKRIFTRPQIIKPIFDDNIYPANNNSYAGNSLCSSNVLIVMDSLVDIDKEALENEICVSEECNARIINADRLGRVEESYSDTIGAVDHIINVIIVNDDDSVYRVYSLLQKEAEYLISKGKYGTLCTVAICEKSGVCAIKAIEALIEGNGWVMPNHEIISNGVVAQKEMDIRQILKAALFLSSKYGQLLTGSVIELGKEK